MNERQIVDALVRHGLIASPARDDPDGYDHGHTMILAKAFSAEILTQRAEGAPLDAAMDNVLAWDRGLILLRLLKEKGFDVRHAGPEGKN